MELVIILILVLAIMVLPAMSLMRIKKLITTLKEKGILDQDYK